MRCELPRSAADIENVCTGDDGEEMEQMMAGWLCKRCS